MSVEVWSEIEDTDYSVSNFGRVMSHKYGKGRILNGVPNPDGYPTVNLCDGRGGRRRRHVHRLVAEAFLGPPPTPQHEVNHKNGDKTDPRDSNLEWVTRSGNQRHRRDVLKHGNDAHGEKVGTAKLTEVEAREILRRCAAGETYRRVAADYGVSFQNVCLIVTGKSWAWLKQEI